MRRPFILIAALALAAIPATVRADSAGDLTKAADRFGHLRSWHADEAAASGTSAIDYAAPDRFRITAHGRTQYLIGSTMYVDAGGHMMKLNVPQAAATVQRLRSPAHAAQFVKSHSFKDLGPSSVGGVATHAYAFDDTSYGITTHDVIDIGVADGLPHRQVVKSNQGTTTITYSRFNAPVKINPPG